MIQPPSIFEFKTCIRNTWVKIDVAEVEKSWISVPNVGQASKSWLPVHNATQ